MCLCSICLESVTLIFNLNYSHKLEQQKSKFLYSSLNPYTFGLKFSRILMTDFSTNTQSKYVINLSQLTRKVELKNVL